MNNVSERNRGQEFKYLLVPPPFLVVRLTDSFDLQLLMYVRTPFEYSPTSTDISVPNLDGARWEEGVRSGPVI